MQILPKKYLNANAIAFDPMSVTNTTVTTAICYFTMIV